MEKNTVLITPKTKVLQLIEAYPQLEDLLISFAPAFKKLKNPVLRKTVAKIATLQQAAAIGGVKVEELINALRKEAGQDLYAGSADTEYNTVKPDWFNETAVENELDIRKMLDAGEQPVNQAVSDLNSLSDKKIYRIIAPFIPAPLIDKASSLGMLHWVDKQSEELYHVYFTTVPEK
jgi:hypothetical protein